MSDNEKLADAILSLSIVLEEITNQLALLRFEISANKQDKTKQCIYNHECNNCGRCIENGLEFGEENV